MNVRVLVNLSGGASPEAIKQKIDFIRASKYPDRFRVFANVNWDGADAPGWAEKAVADLEASVKNGAIGLKIFKNLGLHDEEDRRQPPEARRPGDEARLAGVRPARHPRAHPHRRAAGVLLAARLQERALARTGALPEPPQQRARASRRSRTCWASATACSRPTRRRATSRAHFGCYGNDLQRAAAALDRLPNMVLEVSAVLYEFGRQPRAAREFFIKYQDRILFGKDAYEPREYPYYWRVFETGDEYFDYYRDYHAFWKLYGMELPDAVLRKVYYANALRVTPACRRPAGRRLAGRASRG